MPDQSRGGFRVTGCTSAILCDAMSFRPIWLDRVRQFLSALSGRLEPLENLHSPVWFFSAFGVFWLVSLSFCFQTSRSVFAEFKIAFEFWANSSFADLETTKLVFDFRQPASSAFNSSPESARFRKSFSIRAISFFTPDVFKSKIFAQFDKMIVFLFRLRGFFQMHPVFALDADTSIFSFFRFTLAAPCRVLFAWRFLLLPDFQGSLTNCLIVFLLRFDFRNGWDFQTYKFYFFLRCFITEYSFGDF